MSLRRRRRACAGCAPCRLYIAASARLTSSVALSPSSGNSPPPTLALTFEQRVVDDERFPKSPADALHRGADVVLAPHVGEDHGELVAAEARHDVVASADRTQAPGDLPDQVISGVVAVLVVDLLEVVEVDEQQPDAAVARTRSVERAVDPLAEADAVQEPRETVVVGAVAQLVNELPVLDRGCGQSRDTGHPREQVLVGAQPLRALCHGHREDPHEDPASHDRDDRQGDDAEAPHEGGYELVVCALLEEQRVRLEQHALQRGRVARRDPLISRLAGTVGVAPPGRLAAQAVLAFVPQPHRDPVAVHDRGNCRRQALGDFGARARLRQRVGQREQRAHLLVLARGLLQRERHVEHDRGMPRVVIEDLPFLLEELHLPGVARDQLAVGPARGRDVRDEHPRGTRCVGAQARTGQLARLLLADTAAVDLQGVRGERSHGEHVARRAHRIGGAVDDAMQGVRDVLAREQVAGHRVDAAEPLGHRVELRLERGHAQLRIGRPRGQLRVPCHGVDAPLCSARLAFALLHVGERESEQLRGAGEQTGGPFALKDVARVAAARSRRHDRATRHGLDRVHLRAGAQRGRRAGDRREHRLNGP